MSSMALMDCENPVEDLHLDRNWQGAEIKHNIKAGIIDAKHTIWLDQESFMPLIPIRLLQLKTTNLENKIKSWSTMFEIY